MNWWLISITAFSVTMLVAPGLRNVLIRYDVIDRPNMRSSHTQSVPRGGGSACLLGLVASALVGELAGLEVPWPALSCAVILAFVGLVDDHASLSARSRLLLQVSVGLAFGMFLGGGIWVIVSALCVPLAVNVVNFMDGINGLTATIMALWGSATVIYGYGADIEALMLIGAISLGAALGFLPWNIPQARMFLGDVGSYLFGALAGVATLLGSAAGAPPTILAAPLTVYIFDVLVTILRRLIRRAPITEAHREHIYQRLTNSHGRSHVYTTGYVGVLSAVITAAWHLVGAIPALCCTAAMLTLYASSPALASSLVRKSACGGARQQW